VLAIVLVALLVEVLTSGGATTVLEPALASVAAIFTETSEVPDDE
jgi:hypothetical protein